MRDKWLIGAAVGLFFLLVVFRKTVGGAVSALTDDSSFNRFDSLFRREGTNYGVPWRWLKSIAIIESSLGSATSVAKGIINPENVQASVSYDGKSWGLMQVTLETARGLEGQLITPAYLNDPNNSVRLAAKLLKQLISRFGIGDRESVIRAYNGGPGFRKTMLGQTLTPIYYAKFLSALGVVQTKQPGNEMEGFK